jgi:hypothetical protein
LDAAYARHAALTGGDGRRNTPAPDGKLSRPRADEEMLPPVHDYRVKREGENRSSSDGVLPETDTASGQAFRAGVLCSAPVRGGRWISLTASYKLAADRLAARGVR